MTTENIAVIGDIMLDEHVKCEVIGFSPEDDLAPKLRIRTGASQPGGAANVATNLKSLGCAHVELFGVIGKDEQGRELNAKLKALDIWSSLLQLSRPTTTKTRYLTEHGRHVARVDREYPYEVADDELICLIEQIDPSQYSMIIISDYSKGVITRLMMDHLHKYDTKIIVDPKRKDFCWYGPVYAITPNETEAMRSIPTPTDLYGIIHQAKHLIVTKSKEGCTILSEGKLTTFGARAREIGDPTGCGDSFIAGLGLYLARGETLERACGIATAAGACAVDHKGAYAVTAQDLAKELTEYDYFTQGA